MLGFEFVYVSRFRVQVGSARTAQRSTLTTSFSVEQRPQLVKGNMQLFSVDQQRSQALESHAAAFASFKVLIDVHRTSLKTCVNWSLPSQEARIEWPISVSKMECHFVQVPGNDTPSILISFATKSSNAGQITSKLHIIELGAQPGLRTCMQLENLEYFTVRLRP